MDSSDLYVRWRVLLLSKILFPKLKDFTSFLFILGHLIIIIIMHWKKRLIKYYCINNWFINESDDEPNIINCTEDQNDTTTDGNSVSVKRFQEDDTPSPRQIVWFHESTKREVQSQKPEYILRTRSGCAVWTPAQFKDDTDYGLSLLMDRPAPANMDNYIQLTNSAQDRLLSESKWIWWTRT